MDVQAAPPTYTPAGSVQPPSGNPPVLGQQVPGFSGGLPAQAGLSVLNNPMAGELMSTPPQPQQQTNNVNPNTMPNQAAPNANPYPPAPQYAGGGTVQKAEQVRQMGRGEDSVLMHVTPHELKGLQALAMAHGGSLTINPHTGLPEAGFLGNLFKKLLPTVLGVGLAATGVGAPLAAGIVGLGSTAATGSLRKGLMAGLGAYGGASLAGAAGLGGSISKNAFGVLGDKAGLLGANMGAGLGSAGGALATSGGANAGITAAENAFFTGMGGTGVPAVGSTAGLASAAPSITGAEAKFLTKAGGQFVPKAPGLFTRFGQTAAQGLPKGIISKAAPMLAASGLMQGVSGALSPSGGRGIDAVTGAVDNSYQGPYYAQDRQQIMYDEAEPTSQQRRHFAVSMPEVRNTFGQVVAPGSMTPQGTPILQQFVRPKPKKGQPMYDFRTVPYMGGPAPMLSEQDMGYAHGGVVHMEPGSFVYPARETAEHGGGDTIAGQKELAKLGGIPIRGPGDGTSDSIKASIGGRQEARVATGEVLFPPEAVRRIGGGSEQKGTQKLYAMMRKAEQSRKKASRGADGIKLRKGLA